MSQINGKRVVLGGLVAGVISNISGITLAHFFFEEEVNAAMQRLNLTFGPGIGVLHLTMRLAMGVALVWLYAAIRPRFGPGPRTALIAGTAMWLFAYVWSLLGMYPYRIYSAHLLLIAGVWSLFEANLCALVGGWLYREP